MVKKVQDFSTDLLEIQIISAFLLRRRCLSVDKRKWPRPKAVLERSPNAVNWIQAKPAFPCQKPPQPAFPLRAGPQL
jgi:hypothetical protein